MKLLTTLQGVDEGEAQKATAIHFVWVLRDQFYNEREQAAKDASWATLIARWVELFELPDWALDHRWWRHPKGTYNNDPNFVVSPVLGWTETAIKTRGKGWIKPPLDDVVRSLTWARRVMNTELDALVQTPRRLILIECKDKTDFKSEQRRRQQELATVLERLLPRPEPIVFVEVSRRESKRSTAVQWTWGEVEEVLGEGR